MHSACEIAKIEVVNSKATFTKRDLTK